MKKKILIGIVAILAVMLIAMISVSVWLVSSNNTSKGDKKEVLSSKVDSPKKALIIYQPSKTNISSQVAHKIGKGLNSGGYEVTLNYPGKHLSSNISSYSVVVFGSPVYMGKPSTVLTDYMSRIKDYSHTLVVLYSTGGSHNYKEFDIMKKHLGGKKPYKKVKFYMNGGSKNNKKAHDLGKELSKK